MAYAIHPDPDNPIHAAFCAALAEERREKEAYLRITAPQYIRQGYRLSDLALEEKNGPLEWFAGQPVLTSSYRLVIRFHHTRRMLAFRRRMRRFTRGVHWKREKGLGLL